MLQQGSMAHTYQQNIVHIQHWTGPASQQHAYKAFRHDADGAQKLQACLINDDRCA